MTLGGSTYNISSGLHNAFSSEEARWEKKVVSFECKLMSIRDWHGLVSKRVRSYFNNQDLKPGHVVNRFQRCELEFSYNLKGPGSAIRRAIVDTTDLFNDKSGPLHVG